MKGRKPAPAPAVLQGNFAVTESVIPEPPTRLAGAVKAAWEYLIPLVASEVVLKLSDSPQLYTLCRAWADYLAAGRKIPHGRDGVTKRGGAQSWNNRASARDKAEARCIKLATEFGLSPLERQHVETKPLGATQGTISGFARKRNG